MKPNFVIITLIIAIAILITSVIYIKLRGGSKTTNIANNISPHYFVKNDTNLNFSNVVSPSSDILGEAVVSIKKKWGVYTGWRPSDIQNFEKVTQTNVDYIATFVHWGNENQFPKDLANYAKSNGKTLVIFWEAMDYNDPNDSSKRFTYDKILAKKWDSYIKKFVRDSRSFKSNFIIIPFEEANGDWYSWSGTAKGNSSYKFRKAYRYLKRMFSSAPNAKFGLALNAHSFPDTPENSIASYYPGTQYVDYVGLDGFNFDTPDNPWMSFDEIFSSGLETLSKYSEPTIIWSMACTQDSRKAAWLEDAIAKISNNSKITGWIWFNEDKEKDWTLWSDPQTLATLRTFVNN